MTNRLGKTIHKFPLKVVDRQEVMIPAGALLLCVQTQVIGGVEVPCLWAEVSILNPPAPRQIAIYGTGNPLPDVPGRYLGTVQVENDWGMLVWHAYDRTGLE